MKDKIFDVLNKYDVRDWNLFGGSYFNDCGLNLIEYNFKRDAPKNF